MAAQLCLLSGGKMIEEKQINKNLKNLCQKLSVKHFAVLSFPMPFEDLFELIPWLFSQGFLVLLLSRIFWPFINPWSMLNLWLIVNTKIYTLKKCPHTFTINKMIWILGKISFISIGDLPWTIKCKYLVFYYVPCVKLFSKH